MSRPIRIRRSAEQWRALLDEQADSVLSQAAFCQREKLAPCSFAKWKRRLSSTASDRTMPSSDSTPWINLGHLGAGQSGWDVELDLGGGVCLRLRRRWICKDKFANDPLVSDLHRVIQ